MIFRREIGWLVAQAYIFTGVRRRIVRKCGKNDLVVPVCFHAPTPSQLDAILSALNDLVGIDHVEVSFDDGRKSVKDCIPVLEKFAKKATLFISPGEILRGYNWAENRFAPGMPDFTTLCRMDEASRNALFEAKGTVGEREGELLTEDDIQELSKSELVEFGNHTWSHMSCVNRPVKEFLEELDRAQKQIEEWTGQVPVKFSYPFGHDSDELDGIVRARGLVPYSLRPGLVTSATLGRARNMAYEDMSVAENVGRLLTAWPKVRRMSS